MAMETLLIVGHLKRKRDGDALRVYRLVQL